VVNLSEEEQLIKNEDLQMLIQKAIEQKNYRLAVRYYYLQLLQRLSDKQLIDWQQQKTNEDYISEIELNPLKEKFKWSTYLYDFIWYGNFDIDQAEFSRVEAAFSEADKLIN